MDLEGARLGQIENDLILFFRNKALPRFMRDLRQQVAENRYGAQQLEDQEFMIQEFAEWLQYGGHAAPPYDESMSQNGPKRTPTP